MPVSEMIFVLLLDQNQHPCKAKKKQEQIVYSDCIAT